MQCPPCLYELLLLVTFIVYIFFFKVAQDSKLQDKFWTVTHVLGIKMLLEITD